MTSLDDTLAALAVKFSQRAGDEVAALDKLLEDADRDGTITLAHRLAGIAGMVGHSDIGRAALELEEAALEGKDYAASAGRLRAMLLQLGEGLS